MTNDLKAKLSLDVYNALTNIKKTKKELGGGRSKKQIDSTTEYNELAQLLAGNGAVARNKMTETDIKTLEAELANAEKWKPVDVEENNNGVAPDTNEKPVDTEKNNNEVAPDTNEKPVDTEKNNNEVAPDTNKKSEGESAPDSQPKQKTQTQNNNFNNSGINNSFYNSGTIIIDKSVHYDGSKTESADSTEDTKGENKSKTEEKEDTIRTNKENYQVAHDEGAQVAEDLIGFTTQTEKTRAIRNIMKQNENTIIGFMQGYYSKDSVTGIPYGIGELLDQVDNENGWTTSEKTRVFIKVMESTLKYAENTRNTENSNYKELTKLLNDAKTGKEINTETADAYIKELITAGAIDVNS